MTSPVAQSRQRWKNLINSRPAQPGDGTESAFVAPNNGFWQLDRSHHSGGTTLIAQKLMTNGIEVGGADMFDSLGIPIRGMYPAYVHGYLYVQMRSVLGSRTPKWVPPSTIVRRLFAASPLGRRCEATARRALAERPWQQSLRDWPRRARELTKNNQRWQRFDLVNASDAELAAHTVGLYNYCEDGFVEHFRLHGVDLVPIGMLLSQGAKWGIPRRKLLDTLNGASDATAIPQRALDRIARTIARDSRREFASRQSVTLDEIRRSGTEIAAAIDAFLDRYGSTVVEGYDIDGRTLAELPELIARRLFDASDPNVALPARVPAAAPTAASDVALDAGLNDQERIQFAELVEEARCAVAVREEQGPLTIQWPVGLLRTALLEIGRRRVAAERWADARLALELRAEELTCLGSADEPGNDELVARRATRIAQRRMIPPNTLGAAVAVDPDPNWFTPAVAQMVDLLLVTTAELGIRGTTAKSDPGLVNDLGSMSALAPKMDGLALAGESSTGRPLLSGFGIGTTVVVGIARVVTNDDEVFGFVQPGEILVTHATSPAYNLVLGQVGGLITTSQGAMSHAAVLARELGLTAVVGVTNATEILRSGDELRLDPGAGTVEILGPQPR